MYNIHFYSKADNLFIGNKIIILWVGRQKRMGKGNRERDR